jgi:hypothetical protein
MMTLDVGDTFEIKYNLLTYLTFALLSIFPARIMSNMENKWRFFHVLCPNIQIGGIFSML